MFLWRQTFPPFLRWNSHARSLLWSAATTGSANSFHTHDPLPQEKHSSVFVSTMPGLYQSSTFKEFTAPLRPPWRHICVRKREKRGKVGVLKSGHDIQRTRIYIQTWPLMWYFCFLLFSSYCTWWRILFWNSFFLFSSWLLSVTRKTFKSSWQEKPKQIQPH